MEQKQSVVVVTGANKGIGLQLAREFATKGLTTILTCRGEQQGRDAVELLHGEGLRVGYHQLDITDHSSVQGFASWILQEHGGLDILVNNAALTGFMTSGIRSEPKVVIDTNYYGTKRVIEALLPLIKPGGRIINVSSRASDLDLIKNEWASKLEDVANLTLEEIDVMLTQCLRAAEEGNLVKQGWPSEDVSGDPLEDSTPYCISKAALNAYSRILARELAGEGKDVSVNCTCPGGTSTNMTGHRGHGLDVGADTPLWLALAPRDVIGSGHFYTLRTNVGFRGIPLNLFGKLVTYEEIKALFPNLESQSK